MAVHATDERRWFGDLKPRHASCLGAGMIERAQHWVGIVALALAGAGCAPESPDPGDADDEETAEDADALSSGINGGACARSPYNCKLRVSGGNRVETSAGSELWGVFDGPVLDGNGDVMVDSTWDHLRFQYGQTRHIDGRTYAFVMASPNSSSGWFPLDRAKGEESLRAKIGEVNARASGLDKLGCYQVRDSHSQTLALKKVVYDTDSVDNEAAGDYLALPRKNGARYANLVFNTPGYALGGVAVDIFPAGTKFRRLDVPTDSGKPSIDVPLWVKASNGRYTRRSGSLKFVYGTVKAADGARRNGWMAYEALRPSTGCP